MSTSASAVKSAKEEIPTKIFEKYNPSRKPQLDTGKAIFYEGTTTNGSVIIKKLTIPPENRDIIKYSIKKYGEISSLQGSETICKLIESVGSDESDEKGDYIIWLIMQKCGSEDLFYYLQRPELTIIDVLNIACDILKAVIFLNRNRLEHLDIKTENVAVGIIDGKLKAYLIDMEDIGFDAIDHINKGKPHINIKANTPIPITDFVTENDSIHPDEISKREDFSNPPRDIDETKYVWTIPRRYRNALIYKDTKILGGYKNNQLLRNYNDIFGWCILCMSMIKWFEDKIFPRLTLPSQTSQRSLSRYQMNIFRMLVLSMFTPNCGKMGGVDIDKEPKDIDNIVIDTEYCDKIITGLTLLSNITNANMVSNTIKENHKMGYILFKKVIFFGETTIESLMKNIPATFLYNHNRARALGTTEAKAAPEAKETAEAEKAAPPEAKETADAKAAASERETTLNERVKQLEAEKAAADAKAAADDEQRVKLAEARLAYQYEIDKKNIERRTNGLPPLPYTGGFRKTKNSNKKLTLKNKSIKRKVKNNKNYKNIKYSIKTGKHHHHHHNRYKN